MTGSGGQTKKQIEVELKKTQSLLGWKVISASVSVILFVVFAITDKKTFIVLKNFFEETGHGRDNVDIYAGYVSYLCLFIMLIAYHIRVFVNFTMVSEHNKYMDHNVTRICIISMLILYPIFPYFMKSNEPGYALLVWGLQMMITVITLVIWGREAKFVTILADLVLVVVYLLMLFLHTSSHNAWFKVEYTYGFIILSSVIVVGVTVAEALYLKSDIAGVFKKALLDRKSLN